MRFALILVLVVGCGSTPNPKSCLDSHCSDPARPFCDADGSIGGEPNTCIAVDCVPNAFEECRADSALTCNAKGDSYDLLQCEFGCGASGCNECTTAECEKHIIPKYMPAVCNTFAVENEFRVATSMTLDTGGACTQVLQQSSGPEICVIRAKTISVNGNATVRVIGSRALALVADDDLTITGVVDASATVSMPGPGGGTVISGESTSAGGGAGYKTAGANGGSTTTAGGAQNGGSARTNPIGLAELVGGSKSSAGRNNGGGAVAFVSCRGTVTVGGVIDGNGGGGAAGDLAQTVTQPRGGGSGGTIVLQGKNVTVTGELYANGGGGGGGGIGAGAGGNGPRSTGVALGGTATSGNGRGGNGGANNILPAVGSAGSFPGAGGGSTGYILVYTPANVFPALTPMTVSPAFEPKQTVETN